MAQSDRSHKSLLIGLSGPSSSGKTTLARLLREIFTIPATPETSNRSMSLTIIHEDDFYKTDAEIPTITTPSGRTLQDWDCAAALDLPRLQSTLEYITAHGALPPDLTSKEDKNAVGPHGVPDETISALHAEVRAWLASLPPPKSAPALHSSSSSSSHHSTTTIKLFLLDGFLLYPSPSASSPFPHPQSQSPPFPSPPLTPLPPSIPPLLPLKLFLRSTRAQTLSRRLARPGYVTLEGFWADPPGYVEEVVWPNYVRSYGWVFEGGDVDKGEVSAEAGREGVRVGPRAEGEGDEGGRGMEEVVRWGVGEVRRGVGRWVGGRGE